MMDYKKAGVDIEAGYKSVELMKEHVKKTMRAEVLGGLGGFSGAFSLAKIKEMAEPVLLSRKLWDGDRLIMVTDGVLDALPGDDKEQVMGQFLESLEEMPPQDMAERILEFALSFVPGARDDMTVLTAQVWKR